MFTVVVLVALGGVALALDGAYYFDSKRRFDNALDMAALAATSDLRRTLMANANANRSTSIENAKRIASALFNERVSQRGNVVLTAFNPGLTVNDRKITATFSYSASLKPFILPLLRSGTLPFAGKTSVTANTLPYIEITLLVDTSASMGLGVDAAAQNRMQWETGCAFACHDRAPFLGYQDRYAYAKANGITLRIDAVNSALRALLDRFDSIDPTGTYIKASIWSFNTYFQLYQPMTNNRTALRNNLPNTLALWTNDYDAATKFKEGISLVTPSFGTNGDGSSPSSPLKILMLATDGVQDPGKYWTWLLPARLEVDAFDMTFCNSLKAAGIRVGIVHTPYLPIPWDWGYAATLGQPSLRGGSMTRADDVAPTLKACAGSDYHVAQDQEGIINGFQNIFSDLLGPRLTQ